MRRPAVHKEYCSYTGAGIVEQSFSTRWSGRSHQTLYQPRCIPYHCNVPIVKAQIIEPNLLPLVDDVALLAENKNDLMGLIKEARALGLVISEEKLSA